MMTAKRPSVSRGAPAFDHDSALICETCEESVRAAADALADAVESYGWLDDLVEPLAAYRKARGDA